MPRTLVPAGRLFIEVTPAMRRALELLADATILVLDEIDGDVTLEDGDDDQDIADEPHDEHDQDPLEHTANETYGRGYFLNFGPREDDAEEGDTGVADADALSLEFGEEGYR